MSLVLRRPQKIIKVSAPRSASGKHRCCQVCCIRTMSGEGEKKNYEVPTNLLKSKCPSQENKPEAAKEILYHSAVGNSLFPRFYALVLAKEEMK